MRVVWLTRYGDPSVLEPGTAPDPLPGPGQVVVDVAYANITFVETMFRATGFGPYTGDLPMVPGNGVGGVVGAVGPGVDPALVGTRVVTSTGGSGAYASRVAVDAAGLVPVPADLALDTAVALLADGRTALLLLRAAAPRPGERVLVEAAAGGVGTLLVQLAKAAGATVLGAAGGGKLGLVADLGADRAVDYTAPGWADGLGPVDVVFDGVGGAVARAAFGLLDRGGRMLSYGLSSGAWSDVTDAEAAARGVTLLRGATGTPAELRALTGEALRLAAAGGLRPVIGQRFPLERAADAHAAIEARATRGKTLLVVDQALSG
ncbi:zinc-binding dehydrogenase [Asanoa siamensis]|uniref:NADPH:quinone reductase n=1 Tax=Asanoa siamensis TaxID=926357 RepID=A0ABQ4CHN1_9ACTN|nr:zinc-binding dehydrogenase [Asanoa siamensis]GIF70804.1 NADPH:quinone reductase [Asanoa siamensis]